MQAYIRKYSLLFAIPLLLCIGCKDPSPVSAANPKDSVAARKDGPVILSPANNSEFGFEDEIAITWKEDSSVTFFESQLISNHEKFYTDSDAGLFDSDSFLSGNNFYNLIVSGSTTQKEYFGFRVRQIINKDTSKWSKILSFVTYPLGTMNKITITLNSVYNFTTQNKHLYYSGLADGNYLNLDSALAIYSLPVGKVITIKPIQGKIYYDGNSDEVTEFYRLVFGIGTQPESVWPFDVIADTYTGGAVPVLKFYPSGGKQRNFKSFFTSANPQINMAYILSDTSKINIPTKLTAAISFDVYYK
jgi:hypothetical protein